MSEVPDEKTPSREKGGVRPAPHGYYGGSKILPTDIKTWAIVAASSLGISVNEIALATSDYMKSRPFAILDDLYSTTTNLIGLRKEVGRVFKKTLTNDDVQFLQRLIIAQ
jgi:hypothetical protein